VQVKVVKLVYTVDKGIERIKHLRSQSFYCFICWF